MISATHSNAVRRWVARSAVVLLIAGIACGVSATYLFVRVEQQDPGTMRGLAGFLWVREEPTQADIAYVLGGDYLERIPQAVRLYEAGIVNKIVIPREFLPSLQSENEHFSDLSIKMARERGVPAADIVDWSLGRGVENTVDEMSALRHYVHLFPEVSSVVLVTSTYHTRRAKYLAQRFLPRSVRVQTSAVQSGRGNLENWWLTPEGRETVWGEYRKLLYYVPRYLFGG